jgi:DNA-binding NtrC family response regulator
LLRRGATIDAADITFDQELNADTGIAVPAIPPGVTLEQMLARLERQIIENALRQYQNNRERVARELGLARSSLFKRLREWGHSRGEESE